ncbi:MAG TPA: class I SAM-dependent methyltransferase [Coxiellaceae bacterium]|nr:class I SAM-dependent methyltransferase [Coxiellaceae bacterium]
MTSLPSGDHTPDNYALAVVDWRESVKRPLRRWLYPILNQLLNLFLAKKYATAEFKPDLWLWGQRGNDYERQRRRVNSFLNLNNKTILIAGCGTGRDIESWLPFAPQKIVGVDWFNYERAWQLWQSRFASSSCATEVRFAQGDLAHLAQITDQSIDVVASDAVFEHLRNLPEVLTEFHRVLRSGGLLYATFGPLWCAWGGDHISGYDGIHSGFNHLLLNEIDWHNYLKGAGVQTHSEHDGRTWIEHDLFSRLLPKQYLDCLTRAGFERVFVAAIIDPRAVQYLQQNPKEAQTLQQRYTLLDLLVTGMTIIYRRV